MAVFLWHMEIIQESINAPVGIVLHSQQHPLYRLSTWMAHNEQKVRCFQKKGNSVKIVSPSFCNTTHVCVTAWQKKCIWELFELLVCCLFKEQFRHLKRCSPFKKNAILRMNHLLNSGWMFQCWTFLTFVTCQWSRMDIMTDSSMRPSEAVTSSSRLAGGGAASISVLPLTCFNGEDQALVHQPVRVGTAFGALPQVGLVLPLM